MAPAALKPSTLLLLSTVLLSITGCGGTPTPPDCSPPAGANVDTAFQEARQDLAHPACQFRFEQYFDQLMVVAAGDPQPQHAQRFSDFLLWANSQDVITKMTAKELYTRYFSARFASLPDEYSNCSYTCEMRDDIVSKMQAELRDKDRGLIKVTGDRDKYAQANRNFMSVRTLMEATCKACQASP